MQSPAAPSPARRVLPAGPFRRVLWAAANLPTLAALGVVTAVWALCCPPDLPYRRDDL